MKRENITHIHLQRNDNEGVVDVFVVDNKQKVEERISLRYSEMNLTAKLSRAFVFVQRTYIELLTEAQLIDAPGLSDDENYDYVILTEKIHNHLDHVDNVYFKLKKQTAEV